MLCSLIANLQRDTTKGLKLGKKMFNIWVLGRKINENIFIGHSGRITFSFYGIC